MGSVLHGCARTTPRIRAELARRQVAAKGGLTGWGYNIPWVIPEPTKGQFQ
jgi:hypothetical protein